MFAGVRGSFWFVCFSWIFYAVEHFHYWSTFPLGAVVWNVPVNKVTFKAICLKLIRVMFFYNKKPNSDNFVQAHLQTSWDTVSLLLSNQIELKCLHFCIPTFWPRQKMWSFTLSKIFLVEMGFLRRQNLFEFNYVLEVKTLCTSHWNRNFDEVSWCLSFVYFILVFCELGNHHWLLIFNIGLF